MDLSKLDIVYFVKDSAFNEEIIYSLRSVDKNFPHNRVVFYGGRPIGVKPDLSRQIVQRGMTKWDRVRDMLITACTDDAITEDFILFNDDFFVQNPISELPYYADGTLGSLISRIKENNRRQQTAYTKQIAITNGILQERGLPTNNFELHVPIIINRKRMLEVRKEFPGIPASRTLYGNFYSDIEPKQYSDCKIWKRDETPPAEIPFFSTNDDSFHHGKVGGYIKQMFPDRSRFER